MLRNLRAHRAMSAILMLTLAALFVVSAFALVIIGTQAYRNIVSINAESTRVRILSSYVTSKLCYEDGLWSVSCVTDQGLEMLVLRANFGGSEYITRIYCYGGYLLESYASMGYDFQIGDGQRLCEADSMKIETENGAYKVTMYIGDTAYVSYASSVAAEREWR